MDEFRISYDDQEDILYLGKPGQEYEVLELSPGVSLEFDADGQLIGIELLKASSLMKEVIPPMNRRLAACG